MTNSSKSNSILVILTGGRIDSVWDGGVDEVVVAKHSVIPDYLKNLEVEDIKFKEVCMKDSRALTLDDRKSILKAIEESETDKILITHGIHTLTDTVEFLKTNLRRNDRTIVLTGSYAPLKDFVLSDAPFNLGYALAKVEELPTGIYFCINKKTIPAGKIS